jgi:hypothetical protein
MIGGSDSNRSEKQGRSREAQRPKEAISKDTIAGTRTGSEADLLNAIHAALSPQRF